MVTLYHLITYLKRRMSLRDSWNAARQTAAQERRWRAMWRERYWK